MTRTPLDLTQFEGHTLGPWHIGMHPGPMIYGTSGEQIADMRHPAMVDDTEHAFNLSLIAAAPALLSECKRLREREKALMEALEDLHRVVSNRYPSIGLGGDGLGVALIEARAALKEGGQ